MTFKKGKYSVKRKLNILQINKEIFMNNTELLELFRAIDNEDNCFDRELALRKIKKLYKKSEFYKQTRYSLHRAYLLYSLGAFNNITKLLNSEFITQLCHGDMQYLQAKFEDFIDGIDAEKIEKIFHKIATELENFAMLDTNMQNTLEGVIKDFQNSLK